jgi:hypothetical protein
MYMLLPFSENWDSNPSHQSPNWRNPPDPVTLILTHVKVEVVHVCDGPQLGRVELEENGQRVAIGGALKHRLEWSSRPPRELKVVGSNARRVRFLFLI